MKKVSEAREILGRLIDAKKTYDQPRSILRRGLANAVKEQEGEGVGDRIDRLERALLSAIEKKNSFVSQEKEKLSGQEENQLQLYYGPSTDGEYQAQANAWEIGIRITRIQTGTNGRLKKPHGETTPVSDGLTRTNNLNSSILVQLRTNRIGLTVIKSSMTKN